MRGNMFDVDSIQSQHLLRLEEVKEENQKYVIQLEQQLENFNAKLAQF